MSILQLRALVGFSILALAFRLINSLGVAQWAHLTSVAVITPHNIGGMLFHFTSPS